MIALADLKEWLVAAGLLDSGDATYDAVLESLEARAVAFVENQTDRYFGPVASVTEVLTGYGGAKLWLTEIPSTNPTTVVERAYLGGAEMTITDADANGFLVRTSNADAWLQRRGGSVWTDGYEYEVSYARGYDADAEPGDIRQLVLDLVTLKFGLAGSEGLKSETIGGYSYTMGNFNAQDLEQIPMSAATLRLWRRPVMA